MLVGKMYRRGFYYPTTILHADSFVHCYEGCQFFAHQKHVSSYQLHTILITCPFSTRGLDLLGPFKKAKGGFTHIFIAVDQFMKLIETKPKASIIVVKAMEFICKIMYWFSIPNNIITDNGTRFTMREFRDFCVDEGIKINYASISHPQSNRQAE
jgi:hypothetical protein